MNGADGDLGGPSHRPHAVSSPALGRSGSLGEDEGAALFREGRLTSAPASVGQTSQPQPAEPPTPFGHDAAAHAYLTSHFLLRMPVCTCQKNASALNVPLRRRGRSDQ